MSQRLDVVRSHSVILPRLPSLTTATWARSVDPRVGDAMRSSASLNSPITARIRSARDGKYA